MVPHMQGAPLWTAAACNTSPSGYGALLSCSALKICSQVASGKQRLLLALGFGTCYRHKPCESRIATTSRITTTGKAHAFYIQCVSNARMAYEVVHRRGRCAGIAYDCITSCCSPCPSACSPVDCAPLHAVNLHLPDHQRQVTCCGSLPPRPPGRKDQLDTASQHSTQQSTAQHRAQRGVSVAMHHTVAQKLYACKHCREDSAQCGKERVVHCRAAFVGRQAAQARAICNNQQSAGMQQ